MLVAGKHRLHWIALWICIGQRTHSAALVRVCGAAYRFYERIERYKRLTGPIILPPNDGVLVGRMKESGGYVHSDAHMHLVSLSEICDVHIRC